VVVEDRPALGVEVQARPRHVALDHRDRGAGAAVGQRAAGEGQTGQRTGGRNGEDAGERQDRGPEGGLAPGTGQGEDGGRGERTGERDGEAHQRHSAVGRQRQQRAGGLAEAQPPPGKPVEDEAAAQRLVGDPQRRRPQRPQPQAGGDRGGAAEQRQVQGLPDGQRDPREGPDVDAGPRQQRQEEGQSEDQPEPRAGAEPPAVHGERQRSGAEGCEDDEVVGGEGEEEQSTAESGQQGPPRPLPAGALGRRPARAGGPRQGAGRTGSRPTCCWPHALPPGNRRPGGAGHALRLDASPSRSDGVGTAAQAVLTQHPIPTGAGGRLPG
jgi:hypothetical protein